MDAFPARWGPGASAGNGAEWRGGARRRALRRAVRLLLLHHERAGEGVGFDHAFALAVGGLQPAAPHSVLLPGGPLDGEVRLVAHLAAVRGVAELERAPRVDIEVEVPGDRLRGEVAVPAARPGPI